jgi:hypothetical protein
MPISRPRLQRIVEHRKVARLEDMQRQPRARQQQRAGQRENRNDFREDRPFIMTGSSPPRRQANIIELNLRRPFSTTDRWA